MMRDYRCPTCSRFLFRADLRQGRVEIKCRECKQVVMFDVPARAAATAPVVTDWHGMRRTTPDTQAMSLTTLES